MVEKSDKIWRIKHVRKFDKQNFDKSIVGFIGKILATGKVRSENFESLAIHQICQTFPLSKILHYTIYGMV